VLFPDSEGGLPPNEITIAEALKENGYRTAPPKYFGNIYMAASMALIPGCFTAAMPPGFIR